jgi:hypothetical protein
VTLEEIRKLDVKDNWSEGIGHEPESDQLVRMIADFDFIHFSDSFCLKTGGDGDNGETLMYILDELIRRKMIEVKVLK